MPRRERPEKMGERTKNAARTIAREKYQGELYPYADRDGWGVFWLVVGETATSYNLFTNN